MPTEHDNELVTYDDVDWNKIPNRFKYRPFPVSEDTLNEWRVPVKFRNWCADKWIARQKCWLKGGMFPEKCHHEHGELEKCDFEEKFRRASIRKIREELQE
eukprot:NODE_11167_length_560_cov_72.993135_g10886_i0.p1 GENE.NODE_11167_length_560_cov_72.993135_g10886_i0~~NODE_11167_length_560_cov_72.993135_g10886_i0.p1  ORF type:complete len:116 (+),score=26.68 NODE_11167_length_560_cov_72.993135_g10886_i0:47-349(+)